MNDLRTAEYDPMPMDELIDGGGEVCEWADSEGEDDEGEEEYAAWRVKMSQRPRRDFRDWWMNELGEPETVDSSDDEGI